MRRVDVLRLHPWPEISRRAADDVSAVVGQLPEAVTSGSGSDDVEGVVVVTGLVLAQPEAQERRATMEREPECLGKLMLGRWHYNIW